MDKTAREGFKSQPVLVDKLIQDLRTTFAQNLSWLNTTFGRAYKIPQHELDGEKIIYPAAYIGDHEYTSLLPNDRYGNFCWFDIYDPQRITETIQALPILTIKGAVVFWFNCEYIFNDTDFMYIEEIKDQILRLLTSPGSTTQGTRISVSAIYERPENIYSGYSLERIYNSNAYKGGNIAAMDKQYFISPYAALRFEFTATTQELCR